MEEVKRLFGKKLLLLLLPLVAGMVVFFILIIAITSFATGKALVEEQLNNMREKSVVINNQLYAERYRGLLNKYLADKGYVSLERLVFYLQRTNNVLDTSTLSYDLWDKAYLANINEEEKQMIPIKTMCKTLDKDKSLPKFTIENGTSKSGIAIDVIDLCNVDGVDITTSNDYDEYYYPLPFSFPVNRNFSITSMVFEYRNVDLGNISKEQQDRTNFHSGWDIAVPTGTNFYSICDGTVSNVVNTQANDLPFKQSGNSTGNYMIVKCTNNLSALYWHIQYKSQPSTIKVGSIVHKNDLLGRTSTTGTSTGPHLHLGLRTEDNELLDAMAYINFAEYKGN